MIRPRRNKSVATCHADARIYLPLVLQWRLRNNLAHGLDDGLCGQMESLMKMRVFFFALFFLIMNLSVQAQERIEQWKGKTVMVFTPHPDDDLFGCGGTLALLAKNGNKIIIVIY